MRNGQYIIRFVIIFAALFIIKQTASAGEERSQRPDFNHIFSQLSENRIRYNALNDSMFLPLQEEAWTDLALRRADDNYRKFDENQKLIDEVTYYFLEKPTTRQDATSGKLKPKPGLKLSDYDALRDAMLSNLGALDPFLGEIFFGNILIPYGEQIANDKNNLQETEKKENARRLVHDYFNFGVCLFNIHSLGDSVAMPKGIDIFKRCMKLTKKYNLDRPEDVFHIFAASHLLSYPFIHDEVDYSFTEGDDIYADIMSQLKDPDIMANTVRSAAYPYNETIFKFAQNYPLLMLRSMILNESKHKGEKAFEKELNKRLRYARKHLDEIPLAYKADGGFLMHSTRALIRARLGEITYDEAAKYCFDIYGHFTMSPDKNRSFKEMLTRFTFIVKDMMHIINKTNISKEKRIQFATDAFAHIISILSHRPHGQLESQESDILSVFFNDSELPDLLDSDDREYINRTLTIVTQIHTLAHSECVGWLSLVILEAVIQKCPEILVGLPGISSVEDLPKRYVEIANILTHAARMHDVGKLRMAEIVNNEFRHLTDHEFSIIKQHPEFAAPILASDTLYQKYMDFSLGHHKWYDGTRGYPKWFDNTKSPYRLLVDILTIADCLEAATNRLSRNYRRYKSFGDTLNEMQKQSGTRYNPDVIQAIISSKETCEELSLMIDYGWKESFHGIFLETIQKLQ